MIETVFTVYSFTYDGPVYVADEKYTINIYLEVVSKAKEYISFNVYS